MINSPSSNMEDEELYCMFAKLCTYITLVNGKKLNTANVFLYFLKSKQLRRIFKKQFEVDSDFECIQLFLKFDPSIYKSKYIMKYLNNTCSTKIMQ